MKASKRSSIEASDWLEKLRTAVTEKDVATAFEAVNEYYRCRLAGCPQPEMTGDFHADHLVYRLVRNLKGEA